MSRSGYIDDDGDAESQWRLIRWRGAVTSALRGKRGQAFLRELIAALDAMPERRLVAHDFVKEGAACALGAVAVARGTDTTALQEMCAEENEEPGGYDLPREMSDALGIPYSLAAEVMYLNDEAYGWDWWGEKKYGPVEHADYRRWRRMRAWAERNLIPEAGSTP